MVDWVDACFWNIEHFNDRVGTARIQRVADVMARMSMDVMGLVEVQEGALRKLVDAIAQRHGDRMDFAVLNVPGSQDLGVLFDTSTTTVELADDINRRHSTALAARTAGGRTAFPREPLFARCEVDQEGSAPLRFMIIVVHLKAFGDAQSRARRRLASEILTEIIDSIRDDEGLPVILGGDFNDVLNTDVLSALQQSPDLFSLTADDAQSGAISFVGDRHRSLIDHIIVSRDLQPGEIAGDDAAIVRLDRGTADFADDISDHVPLVMRVVRRGEPVEPGVGSEPSLPTVSVPAGATSVGLKFD